MAAATLSVGVLLAILEAAPEIRVPFRVDSHHSSKLGGKSQGGRRDRNQPYRESPQRECITLDRTPIASASLRFSPEFATAMAIDANRSRRPGCASRIAENASSLSFAAAICQASLDSRIDSIAASL